MRYDFEYKDLTDDYGDTYDMSGYETLSEAKEALHKIRESLGGEMEVTQTWKYSDDGEYLGSWGRI